MQESEGTKGAAGSVLTKLVQTLHAFKEEDEKFENALYTHFTGKTVLLSSLAQGSTGWFQARKQGDILTASKFGEICGVSPYADARAHWKMRTGKLEVEPTTSTNKMKLRDKHVRRGSSNEARAIEAYKGIMEGRSEGRSEGKIEGKIEGHIGAKRKRKSNSIRNSVRIGRERKVEVQDTGLWLHPEHSFLGASPDGLVSITPIAPIAPLASLGCDSHDDDGDDDDDEEEEEEEEVDSDFALEQTSKGLVEVKCPALAPHEDIPAHYMAQIQGQLEIVEQREWCDFVSWTENNGVNIFRVYRSQQYWDFMLPKLKEFLMYLMIDEEPPARAQLDKSQIPNVSYEKIYPA